MEIRIVDLENRVEVSEKIIKQLGCEHLEWTTHTKAYPNFGISGYDTCTQSIAYSKVCKMCKKEVALTKEEYYEARAQEIVDMKEQLKKELVDEGDSVQ